MRIEHSIFGALATFVGGVLLATAGYAFSRYLLQRHANYYAVGQVVKQLVQIGYVLAVYALAGYTPWDGMWMLLGGCLGITLPMLWFTYRLVKLNDSSQGKEDERDG